MNLRSKQQGLNKVSIWLVTAKPEQVGLYAGFIWGCTMFILFSLPLLINKKTKHLDYDLIISLVIWAASAYAFGLILGKLYRRQRVLMEDSIGLELSSDDLIELTEWQRFGFKPQSKRLQPHLLKYLDFLEARASGITMMGSNKLKYVGIVLFGIQIPFYIVEIIMSRRDLLGHLVGLLFVSLMTYMFFNFRTGKSNRAFVLLNSRLFKKIDKMRSQLN
jgi:hypothetical protein